MHGDFGLGNDVTGQCSSEQQKPDEPISKLERLSALKEKGMISDRVRYELNSAAILGPILVSVVLLDE